MRDHTTARYVKIPDAKIVLVNPGTYQREIIAVVKAGARIFIKSGDAN